MQDIGDVGIIYNARVCTRAHAKLIGNNKTNSLTLSAHDIERQGV